MQSKVLAAILAAACSPPLLLAQSVPAGSETPQISVVRLHPSVASNGAALDQSNFVVKQDGRTLPIKAFAKPGENTPAELDVVLDTVNQPFTQVTYAEEQVSKFLAANGGKLSQPVALYLMTDTAVTQLAPPTTDGAALNAAMRGSAVLRDINRSAGLYGAVDRLDISLKAMSFLADSASHRPGRKVLLFLSPGWPLLDVPDQTYLADQKRIFASEVYLNNLLLAANATVYMVAPENGSGDVNFHRFVYKSYEKPLTQVGKASYADLALQNFAVHTGGEVFDSSNNVAQELAQSVADANAAYTLVLEVPQSSAEHTTFHSLEVGTNAGKARAADGYYSLAQQ